MVTRRCWDCGRVKPLSAFPKGPHALGRHHRCKPCRLADEQARKARDPDAYRARHRKATRKWEQRNPEKRRAYDAVRVALLDGRLRRPANCERCGQRCAPQASQKGDYTRPLDVRWLCPTCNAAEHAEERERAA